MNIMSTIALVIVGYLLWTTYRRVRGAREDPGISVAADSDTGSATFLLSGSWFVASLAAIVVGLTWPLAMESPEVGVGIVMLVGIHWMIEWRERNG